MNTADQAFVKKHNQNILLHEIIKRSPISRAKLSERTHLNKATVSSQISTLIDSKIIFEIGQGQSSGGRRPVLLVFNKDAGYAIGVDLGVNYLRTVLTDLSGNIVFEDFVMLEDPSFVTVREHLTDRLHYVIKHAPESPYGIVGIGIGIHGFVNGEQMILFTPNSKWDHVDLRGFLQKQYECPILLTNEANAGAYGEKLFGALRDCNNGVFVSVGIGVGAGVIIDGKLYGGTHGLSAELGHMTIDPGGKKCHCGNRGCWELYTSEQTFLHHLSQAKKRTISDIQEALAMVRDSDVDALNSLDQIAHYLGLGVTNIINIFDPERVILKGNLVESSPLVMNTIKNTVAARAFKHVENHCMITVSELGQDATAIGGASFAIQSFLENREASL